MSLLSTLKQFARRRFPNVLIAYHEYHSARAFRREPRATPLGFRFAGHEQMEAGTFEPFETTLVRDHARRGHVFVDIGANAGYFVCIARQEGAHVVAVEPLAANLDLLMANLAANRWMDGVEIFPMGLSAQSGFANLYGGRTGASLTENWSGTSSVWRRLVPLSTLDIVVSSRFRGRQIFVKIDVEGAEYDVLVGGQEVLERSPAPVWLVENNLTEHHPSGLNPRFGDVFEVFWRRGYTARTADDDGRVVEPSDVHRWIDARCRDFGTMNYVFEKRT